MDSNKEKSNQVNKETPLSARVDGYYKEKFYEIAESKHYDKKLLMESMIANYIRQDRELQREENLSFKNEISVITEAVNTLMLTFKTMASKSQDTLNARIDYYEQQIKNLKLDIETKNNELTKVTEDNNNLKTNNEKLTLQNKRLVEDLEERNKEVYSLKLQNAELMARINDMEKHEKEYKKLESQFEKTKKEHSLLMDSMDNYKKEQEINAKMQVFEANNKYNELMADYLRVKEELIKLKEDNRKVGSIILK